MTEPELAALATERGFRLAPERTQLVPYYVLVDGTGCPVAQGCLETVATHPGLITPHTREPEKGNLEGP